MLEQRGIPEKTATPLTVTQENVSQSVANGILKVYKFNCTSKGHSTPLIYIHRLYEQKPKVYIGP